MELQWHGGVREVPAARQAGPPSNGRVVRRHAARRRSRVRPDAARRDVRSRHTPGRDVHRLSARTKLVEQRRRAPCHVLVRSHPRALASVHPASRLGGRRALTAARCDPPGRARLRVETRLPSRFSDARGTLVRPSGASAGGAGRTATPRSRTAGTTPWPRRAWHGRGVHARR